MRVGWNTFYIRSYNLNIFKRVWYFFFPVTMEDVLAEGTKRATLVENLNTARKADAEQAILEARADLATAEQELVRSQNFKENFTKMFEVVND